jgi:quercetin dioxygenase-like cupin family protein
MIAIAELCHDPSASALAAHVRPAHVASYYVLEGELWVTLDAGELRAPAGAWVQVPAGLEHFVAASGDAPVRYLSLHTPGCGAATLLPA